MNEKPKSIAEYDIRNVGLPYVLKYTGNGATIVTYTKRNCWYLVKSGSRHLQNTSSNLCCHWTHIHGFRSSKSCHTALKSVRETFGVATWYIEGDIAKCFDSMDHQILRHLIESKIHDRKFTRLIWKCLRSGYFEFRYYQNSIIGVPQGSVISPILSNIYLNQFDIFIESLKDEFDIGERVKAYKPYKNLNYKLNRHKERRDLTKIEMRKLASKTRKLPTRDPFDSSFRRLVYVRYADDWIIGVRGSHKEAISIMKRIKLFLHFKLKLTLAEDKTLITHAATQKAFFLSVYVFKARHRTYRKNKGKTVRNALEVRLEAPIQKVVDKLTKANFVRNKRSWPKFIWLQNSLPEIINLYNSVLRGYMKYYSFATYIYYLLRGSCAKLLATKLKLRSQGKVFKKFGKSLTVNKEKVLKLFKPGYKNNPWAYSTSHVNYLVKFYARAISSASLLGLVCSLCGSDYRVEMHHVRHLKDIDPKKSLPDKLMMRKKRKQIPLCRSCHLSLHHKK